MDKAKYNGFTILEVSKLHMFQTFYDTLQRVFDQEILQLHYAHTDGTILSMKTEKTIEVLKNFEDISDFSILDENHELFSEKNKNVVGKFNIETPRNIWIDDIVCLSSKTFSFKGKDNTESENKIKGNSKYRSKHIKFEEYKECLDG